MRFPYEAYAKMVAAEESSTSQQVAKGSAVEKKEISESAIEDEPEVEDEPEAEDENLVD